MGFLEDLLGCSAICIISDSYHIVSILKCMCSQNKVIHSFIRLLLIARGQASVVALLLARGRACVIRLLLLVRGQASVVGLLLACGRDCVIRLLLLVRGQASFVGLLLAYGRACVIRLLLLVRGQAWCFRLLIAPGWAWFDCDPPGTIRSVASGWAQLIELLLAGGRTWII